MKLFLKFDKTSKMNLKFFTFTFSILVAQSNGNDANKVIAHKRWADTDKTSRRTEFTDGRTTSSRRKTSRKTSRKKLEREQNYIDQYERILRYYGA